MKKKLATSIAHAPAFQNVILPAPIHFAIDATDIALFLYFDMRGRAVTDVHPDVTNVTTA
jgi:hypothetical protein